MRKALLSNRLYKVLVAVSIGAVVYGILVASSGNIMEKIAAELVP